MARLIVDFVPFSTLLPELTRLHAGYLAVTAYRYDLHAGQVHHGIMKAFLDSTAKVCNTQSSLGQNAFETELNASM